MDWKTQYVYRELVYGHRTDLGLWGMQCLGMFRSFQDIDEYFEKYHITSYMGLTKDKVRPGMLIYKDVRGAQHTDENGNVTYDGPDGIVDADNDQVELGHRSNPYGFTVNLNAGWKDLSLTAQFGASWGGLHLSAFLCPQAFCCRQQRYDRVYQHAVVLECGQHVFL